MPMLNFRFVQPDHIIDLNRVEGLSYIREAGGAREIGAMTRQRDLEFSDVVRARWPSMHEALLQVGHRQTRNRGTIGGSLCHLDPSAELVSLATGYDAVVTVAGPNGARDVAFADFPVAYMTPAIELNELVIGIRFPQWAQTHGYAFVEFARRHGDFAITSAAVLIEADAAGPCNATGAARTAGAAIGDVGGESADGDGQAAPRDVDAAALAIAAGAAGAPAPGIAAVTPHAT